jgi:hypothetical protein
MKIKYQNMAIFFFFSLSLLPNWRRKNHSFWRNFAKKKKGPYGSKCSSLAAIFLGINLGIWLKEISEWLKTEFFWYCSRQIYT